MTTEFEIGSEVACSDGVCGELTRVVLDPVSRTLTHLVVQPQHHRHQGHLVPIDSVASAGKTIQLTCTKAQLRSFEEAEDTDFLIGDSGHLGYDPASVVWMPYYGLHIGSMDLAGEGPGVHRVTYDHVPVGEVEIRRGDPVHATDGEIGRVKGLVIDPGNHQVTHFLLQEGHLWGKKTVAIPISAATRVGDGVRLTLTRDQVRDLPSIEVDHPV